MRLKNPCFCGEKPVAGLSAGVTASFIIIIAMILWASLLPAQNVAAVLPAGANPGDVAVNPVTNKIYVVNTGSNTVTVIDGATNITTTIPVATSDAVAVNPVTNRIYVANTAGTVTIIDGATNAAITTVAAGNGLTSVAVNPVTNKVYAVGHQSNSVTEIDGVTNAVTATITTGSGPESLAINTVTNKIYVTDTGPGGTGSGTTVTVIDGATHSTLPVPVGNTPFNVVANPITDKIYVNNTFDGTVTVIDGATNTTSTISANVGAMAVNAATNKIYAVNNASKTVMVIDGATNAVSAIATTIAPVSVQVNPVTNQIYAVGNLGTGSGVAVIDGGSSQVTATLPISGDSQSGAAINPLTNKVYVVSSGTNAANPGFITVIDGATNSTGTVNAGTNPFAVATNPITGQIYVANRMSDNVSVIDGATNAVSTVNAGSFPVAVAVNLASNRIYVANQKSNTVTVIDAANNNSTTPVGVGVAPRALAVNPATNQIYVANGGDEINPSTVTVIDGPTNATTTVAAGVFPFAIAVNPATNQIYVANQASNNVTVIDGNTHASTTISVGSTPFAIAINPLTNQIYVANQNSNSITIIDGATFATTSVQVGLAPIALALLPEVNQIYVADQEGGDVTVIDGNTQKTRTVFLGQAPTAIAANPASGRVYVATTGVNSKVTVIDEANSVVSFGLTAPPAAVAADPVSGKVYIASNNVTALTEQQIQPFPLVTSISPLPNNHTTSLNPTFTFTLSGSLQGVTPGQQVYFQLDGVQGRWLPASGTAPTFTAQPNLLPGSHILYAFATDAEQSQGELGQSPTISGPIAAYAFTVILPNSTVTLTSSQNPSLFGAQVIFNVSVNPAGEVSGAVILKDGATTIAGPQFVAEDGTQVFFVSMLAVGTHSISAVYSGDRNFSGSTSPVVMQVVNLAATTITLASSANPSVFGDAVTFTATVSSDSGTPTGNVTFMDGNNTLGSGALNGNGMASFAAQNLALSAHTIAAVYNGDAHFSGSASAPLTQTVNPVPTTTFVFSSLNPSNTGASVTFAAIVVSNAGVPSGIVTFSDGPRTLGSVTLNASGQATFNISTLAAGAHSITASYGGQTIFGASVSSALAQVVVSAGPATATTLSAAPNPSNAGTSVSFTATVVSASGVPSGTVNFVENNTVLGNGTLNNSGQTSFSISTLSAGTHSIAASYVGNASFGASTSAPVMQMVIPATATTLSAAPNPSNTGTSVTFTATVVSASGIPAGTVNFVENNTILGSGTLNNSGQASFSISTLSAGAHSIIASYAGNASFGPSTSPVLTQVVILDGIASQTTLAVNQIIAPSTVMVNFGVVKGGASNGATIQVAVSGSSDGDSIVLLDGGKQFGPTLKLAAGAQNYTTQLAVGVHHIQAIYVGNGSLAGSASAVMTVNRSPGPRPR